jgi:hypothetical protein
MIATSIAPRPYPLELGAWVAAWGDGTHSISRLDALSTALAERIPWWN